MLTVLEKTQEKRKVTNSIQSNDRIIGQTQWSAKRKATIDWVALKVFHGRDRTWIGLLNKAAKFGAGEQEEGWNSNVRC